jgi:hypothetical protein
VTVIQFFAGISIYAAAISAGGVMMVALVLVPIFRRYPPAGSVQLHQEVDRHCDRYLRPCTAVSGMAALATLWLQENLRVVSAAVILVGLAGTLAMIVISEAVNVPINRVIKKWSTESIPEDYARFRHRWDRFNMVRAGAGLVALGCYIAAGLGAW